MTSVISSNITTPLGMTTEENYLAVKSGLSSLSLHSGWRNIPEDICASLFSDAQTEKLQINGFTRFESLVIHSVKDAVSRAGVQCTSPGLIFILSTTKANIEELSPEAGSDGNYLDPGRTAEKIASFFGFVNSPIVVCNACISGVTAQLLAARLLQRELYDCAVVCGADCQTPFTVSGFSSFKSLSPVECRPFDLERMGLNLGEAAATVVLSAEDRNDCWKIVSGSLTNDAYHISAPAPDGRGVCKAVGNTLTDAITYGAGTVAEGIAAICAHGTATMFNDQMESAAIAKSGLGEIPVTALKGHFGHTLGASGLMESVIMMKFIDNGLIPSVRGFEETGVSGKINLCATPANTDKKTFLKIISGFGGCNGALLFTKEDCPSTLSGYPEKAPHDGGAPFAEHSVHITAEGIEIDGKALKLKEKGVGMLAEAYKTLLDDYPKFYKMDCFSRLVFIAAELLAKTEGRCPASEGRGMILFNASSSVVADRKHLATINGKDGFFPSPSVFVYTLPNVVLGEIAAKHGYTGETSLYILPKKDKSIMEQILASSLHNGWPDSVITGWADCPSENDFEAELKITR